MMADEQPTIGINRRIKPFACVNSVMILHQFPDIGWLRRQALEGFGAARGPAGEVLPQKGWPSVILHTRTQQACREHIKGTLSVFCNVQGESHAATSTGTARVHTRNYFVSNAGQEYSLMIDDAAETFNVHFGEAFLQDFGESRTWSHTQLLDAGADVGAGSLALPSRSYWRTEAFDRAVADLYGFSMAGRSDVLLEAELLTTLAEVLVTDRAGAREASKSLSASVATREELCRRIYRSVDYIHSYFARAICLQELASVAAMSKFHFLRTFAAVMGQSPYQYLSTVRIEYACHLLQCSEQHIGSIALACGFDNEVSFARAFRRKHNMPASAWRKLSNNGKVSLSSRGDL